MHKYHKNSEDSTFQQARLQAQLYVELHQMGMYINQPDDYFFFGANKAAMGYNEGQFSLPRWIDLSVSSMSRSIEARLGAHALWIASILERTHLGALAF